MLLKLILIFSLITTITSDENVCHKDDLNCQSTKKCKYFKPSDFGPESKSIFFGEARGRFGNQLLGYALLQHFRNVVGVESYVNQECKDYLSKVRTNYDTLLVYLIEQLCYISALFCELAVKVQ